MNGTTLPAIRSGPKARMRMGLELVAPRAFSEYRRRTGRQWEAELDLLPRFADTRCTALDVGANYGTWSHAMAPHFGSVMAFEPNLHLASMLTRIVPANVSVVAAAASDRAGCAWLDIPGLEGHATVADSPTPTSQPCPTVQLDQVLADSGNPSIAFVKIDVEGAEHLVLTGLTRTLEAHRPPLVVEVEERHQLSRPTQTFALLDGLGYEPWELDTTTGRLERVTPDQRRRLNVVFLHQDQAST